MKLDLNNPKIFIYFALPCEAKPLIDRYKLKKDMAIQAFSVFRNDDITLTVTGIGKTAMAAGVAYTMGLYPSTHEPVMLNIGITGHQRHDIGSLFLVDKITDNDTGRSYYPPMVFTPPCPTANLITFAKPQDTYPPATALCDMEASGFFETATRFTSGELCQCLKIVSDNESTPATGIQPNRVSELIHNHMDAIGAIVATLGKLTDMLASPDLAEFQRLTNQFRFTTNEQIQLKKLLSRWHLIHGDGNFDLALSTTKTGKELLLQLANKLKEADFYL